MKTNNEISLLSPYLYSSTEGSEVVLVSERSNGGLKELSQVVSEQTSDSSVSQTAMCLLMHVLNCELHLSTAVALLFLSLSLDGDK
jgi:hypothetical protein